MISYDSKAQDPSGHRLSLVAHSALPQARCSLPAFQAGARALSGLEAAWASGYHASQQPD
jgi:hypothetical protein